MAEGADVLVTGATGFIGRRLIPDLVAKGHQVRALARAGSASRVPAGAAVVEGDVLDPVSVAAALRPGDTVIHLVGTSHPSPSKADEFLRVDLASIRAVAAAARAIGISHLVYVSVAQPAPMMHEYLAARAAGERIIGEQQLTATIVRPWYVVGPGRRWPLLLVPLYALAEYVPAWRDDARRLGLVTLTQMVNTLVRAVEQPPSPGSTRVVDVPGIRAS